MAEGAPLVHNGIVEYRAGAPADLDEYNKKAGDPREGRVIYQFPLHGDIRHNIAAGNAGGIGDVDKAFAEADAVVERTYQTSQVQHTPLETHVCFARMEGGRLTVYASTQVSYHVRRIVGWVTGLPENKIHVVKTRVGGGYGSKQDILIEDLTGYAAYVTGRPVFCHNTREEEFIANSTRHPMRVHERGPFRTHLIDDGAYPKREDSDDRHRNHDDQKRVEECADEDRIREHLHIICQTYKFKGRRCVIEKTVEKAEHHRDDHESHENNQGRQKEHIRRKCLAPDKNFASF